tara:strand:- start:7903 stop:8898 length:996 start_codon:yes stop_codon:yes gene_type:complete
MAAPRPKKTTVVKKKPPVIKKKPSFLKKDTPRPARDLKPGDMRSQVNEGPKKTDVKSPAETRKSISRKQTGTSRPARGVESGSLRDKALKEAQANARSATTPKTSNAGLLRSFGARAVGAAGAIVDPTFLSGKGEGKLNNDPVTRSLEASSTMSAMNKKMKREIRQGPKLAVTGVKEGIIGKTRSLRNKTGQNRPEYPTWKNKPKASKKPLENRLMKPAPGTNYSGQSKVSMSDGGVNNPSGKSSGEALRRAGAGTYTASYDVKAKKATTSNTAATAAAAGSGGTSQVAGGKAKAKVGKQTRYQRNETAMEQRKSSSGKPKKSIFSLFRKG